jgi:hypothetical protein
MGRDTGRHRLPKAADRPYAHQGLETRLAPSPHFQKGVGPIPSAGSVVFEI